MTDEHPGMEELAQRLQAYASARLAPERGATARIRASLMEEARMRSLRMSLARRHGRAFTVGRRIGTLVLAAALVIGAAASVSAASSAGGPLYGPRVWLETALLPTDSTSRAIERIHQIDERVLEVERAAQSGDSGAIAAALSSYDAAVQAAVTEVPADPGHLAHLKAALGLHVVVLETLADQVPVQATGGLDRAIAASQRAVVKIEKTKPDKGSSGSEPMATEVPASTLTPTDAPIATDMPQSTAKAHPTHSDGPDHTTER